MTANLDDLEKKLKVGPLYREESFTDLGAGSIHKLIPVLEDGTPDPSRPVKFTGRTSLMTAGGMIPVEAELPATTLAEAVRVFPEAMRRELQAMMEEMRRAYQEARSRVVIPGQDVISKIQLP